MVLDSPPFPSGNGWGMSLHRWETPSRGGHPPRPDVEQPDHHRRAPDRAGPVDDARRQEHVRDQQRGSRPRRQDRHHGRLLGPELRAEPGRAPGRGVRALDRRRPHLARHAAADLAAAESDAAVRAVRDRRARRRLRARPEHVLRGLARHADRIPRRHRPEPDLVHAHHGRRADVGAGTDHHAHPADPERVPAPGLPQPVTADHGGRQARRVVRHLRRLQPGAASGRRGRHAGRHQAHQLRSTAARRGARRPRSTRTSRTRTSSSPTSG